MVVSPVTLNKGYNVKNKEIVLCSNCKGEGVIEHAELIDYHKGEYRYWDEPCKTCDGKGRLMKEIVITYSKL